MIELTKLNKIKFYLNSELIETVEATPDTVITLRNGKLVIVRETPQEVLGLTMAYKRRMFDGLLNPASPPQVQIKEGDDE
jgi:flagellar protein FlbD